MSKPAIGAVVRYCGHTGTFIADIFEVGDANVVRARPHDIAELNRNEVDYLNATHSITNFPISGFWRPDLGIFVVPGNQVKELKSPAASSLPPEKTLKR